MTKTHILNIHVWNVEGWDSNEIQIENWMVEGGEALFILLEHWKLNKPSGFFKKQLGFTPAVESRGRPKGGVAFVTEMGNINLDGGARTPRIRIARLKLDMCEGGIVGIYGPGAAETKEVEDFYLDLSKICTEEKQKSDFLIVTGDFNAWYGDGRANPATKNFEKWMKEFDMEWIRPVYTSLAATCKGIEKGFSNVDHVVVSMERPPEIEIKAKIVWRESKSKHAAVEISLEWEAKEGNSEAFPPKKWYTWGEMTPEQWGLYQNSFQFKEMRQLKEDLSQSESTQTEKTKSWEKFSTLLCQKRDLIQPMKLVGGTRKIGKSTESSPAPDKITKERAQKLWDEIAKAFEKSEQTNFSFMWKFIKKMKSEKRQNLPRFLKNGNKLLKNKQEIQMEWDKEFSRVERKVFAQEHQGWEKQVREEVEEEMRTNEDGEWGFEPPTRKEIKDALHSFGKRGAPGVDLLTVEMLIEGGEAVLDFLFWFTKKCWEDEQFPDQFLWDLIVPIFKKGNIHIAGNYRPISLMITFVKVLQKIISNRISAGLEKHENLTNPPAGKYGYGGCRGRDRLQVVWLIEAMSASEEITKENGGTILISVQDIKGAFPNNWVDGTNWVLFKLGVTGKLWRMNTILHKGLKGQIRLNGHLTEVKHHQDGDNQGSGSALQRFNTAMGMIMEEIEDLDIGIKLGGVPIPGIFFVDDLTVPVGSDLNLSRWMINREGIVSKWDKKWAIPKDQLLIRRSKGTIKPQSKGSKNITLLGEILTGIVGKSEPQVQKTIKSMKAAFTGFKWLLWAKHFPVEAGSKLVSSWVEAIVRAKLVIVSLTQNQAQRVEGVKAEIGRLILGLPKEVEAEIVYGQLGWNTIWSEIIRIKLIFLGSLWRARKKDPILRVATALRAKQVRKGCRKGVEGELWELLKILGKKKRDELWLEEGENLTKAKWKEKANNTARILADVAKAKFSRDQSDQDPLSLIETHAENRTFLGQREGKTRAILAQIRTGSTQAKGDRIFREKTPCRCCSRKERETIFHLFLKCDSTKAIREIFWKERPEPVEREKKWNQMIECEEEMLKNAELISKIFSENTNTKLFKYNSANIGQEEWEQILHKAQEVLQKESKELEPEEDRGMQT